MASGLCQERKSNEQNTKSVRPDLFSPCIQIIMLMTKNESYSVHRLRIRG